MDLKFKVMGKRQNEAVTVFLQETKIPLTLEEFKNLQHQYQLELFPHCKPMPGAMELLRLLDQNKFPFCLATSSTFKSFCCKIQNHHEMFDLFNGNFLFGDMVKESKPHPEIYLAAQKMLGKQNPLVFEDSILGVEAGLNAGFKVCWVRSSSFAREAEKYYDVKALEERCFIVLESLEEFDFYKASV